VTAWNAKLAEFDIEREIEDALDRDPSYIRGMPLLPGVRRSLAVLATKHEIIAITHRSAETRQVTEEWLRAKGLPVQRVEYTRGSSKADVQVDVLVDDNPRNVQEFADTDGIAILFTQPWNRAFRIEDPKILRANNWEEVLETICRVEVGQTKKEAQTL